ncbi:MAG: C25 family cysteine peptidase, partial [Salibacteraceae bacterium]
VKTFRKSSSSPFQTSLSDSIRTLINNGTALMTFFGHASATGNFDISIDSPDKLNNRGKYPTILANSCFAGNYHQADVMSTGESYVLERNKGAIGFIANGNLGLPYPLSLYSGAFYEKMANANYDATIAENMRLAVKEIQDDFNDLSLKSVCLEMTLQGDPALKMYQTANPDYRALAENVSITPTNLSTDLDSFFIEIQIDNIGRAVNDSLDIRLSHDFPFAGKTDTAYSKVIRPVFYKESIQFRLPIDMIYSAGENRFSLLLDPMNQIDELSVLNNRLDFSVEIRAGEIVPVYPTDFAIVGDQSIKLKASTVYAFEQERTYVFELDTTANFNSSVKESWTKVSRGGVLEWEPQLLQNMVNERVYYWRVSRQPQMGEQANWRTASFQYIAGESGWGQRHIGQYQQNDFQFLTLNENNRKFEYTDRNSELLVRTKGSPTIAETNEILYALDADVRERSACGGTPGFLIAVLDSLTLESWKTPYMGENSSNDFGQANLDNYCVPDRSRSENYFLFRQNDSAQMLAMRDFLLNEIPTNNYVVVYTWFNVNYDNIWAQDSSILRAFEQLGSTEVNNLQNGEPFIFTVKKGKSNSVNEVAGDSTNASIEVRRTLTTSANFGELRSRAIGPGSAWQRLTYQFSKEETNSADSLTVELTSINSSGNRTSILASNAFDLDTNISQLVPNDAEHLELRALSSDDQVFTPPQLDYWQLTFTAAADLALSPTDFYELNADSLEKGQAAEVKIAVRNNSQTAVQAFDLSVALRNPAGQTKWDSTFSYSISLVDTFTIVEFEVPTSNLSGRQQIELELNPQRTIAESNYFNNQGQFDVFIASDQLNPLLDVTFDGRHIMNGELVSAKPEIRLRLEDDNNYLAIEDTSSFSIFLRLPNGEEKLVNFEGSALGRLEFIPAQLPDNVAEVRFNPILAEDGMYRLRVQARDASGNASGANDYQVDFEVVNKSTVTRLLNYPNPFSTSTKFVFTLTGSQIPDQIQIQIMTVTGKVVREIDQFELGPIRIGNNVTEFA